MTTLAPVAESGKQLSASRTSFYPLTIFVASFLLFGIQPIIARAILPWFGGTAAVWTTCMLFFQVVLLLGYLHAYWSVRWLSPKAQALMHVALLAASFWMLPVAPDPVWKPSGAEEPTIRILGLLGATIGLPYFLLSANGPLMQAWFTRARDGAIPYRLYAVSNAGSMLALLSYPVLVEPILGTQQQVRWWSGAYALFVLLGGAIAVGNAFSGSTASQRPRVRAEEAPAPPWDLQLLWVVLAACASSLLLSVTNHLSKNVAPIPFLWILPLSIYLLSFILCFEGRGWYRREWYMRLMLAAFAGMSYGLSKYGETAGLWIVIFIFAAGLFICCMVCHGELAALKPHPRHLTSFYLMTSLGGAVGGAFVGLIAPYLFHASFELPIGIVLCLFLPIVVLYRYPARSLSSTARRQARWAMAGLASALLLYLAVQIRSAVGDAHLTVRNFYGVLRVIDSGSAGQQDATRRLAHGVVNHGEQFLHPKHRRQPTTYYGPDSGVALALLHSGRDRTQRVGVIGLGAGVIAAYGRQGDYYRFYEINPLVLDLANREFSFLKDCPAKVDVVLGDGRLALEREPSQQFDVLAVDAFSGDAVPVHVLTKEAFELYFRHLKPGGVLALNVSSTYLDLGAVGAVVAQALGKEARLVDSDGDEKKDLFPAKWALATDRGDFFEQPAVRKAALRPALRRNVRLWTDDYSNLLQIVR